MLSRRQTIPKRSPQQGDLEPLPKTINVGVHTARTTAALVVAILTNGWSAAERVAERLNLPHAKWLARLVKSLDCLNPISTSAQFLEVQVQVRPHILVYDWDP